MTQHWLVVGLILAAWGGGTRPGRAADAGPAPVPAGPVFTETFNPAVSRIEVGPQERLGVLRASDRVTITTTGQAAIRLMRLDGATIYRGPPLSTNLPVGHYFVETAGDRTQFAVLPDDGAPLSLVGVHDTGSWTFGDQLKAALRPAWERSGHGLWTKVQPRADTWDWAEMDHALKRLAGTGRKVIYIGAGGVPGIPGWVPHGDSFTAYTNNVVGAYTNFVAAALARYAGQLYAWEVFNEPMRETLGVKGWDQIAPLYLALANACRAVRDQVAPAVKLLGPSWQGAPFGDNRWLREHGINRLLDLWSWHDYDAGPCAPDQDYRQIGSLTHRLGDTYGAESMAKPSVVGELCLYGRSALAAHEPDPQRHSLNAGYSWHRGYCRAIKLAVMYRAAGVVGLIPHLGGAFAQYPNPNWEAFGFDYSQGGPACRPRGPHPKTSGLLMACYWLEGATLQAQRSLPAGAAQLLLYEWRRPSGEIVLFAWGTEGTSMALRPVACDRVTDVYGRVVGAAALGEEPRLFHQRAGAAGPSLLERVAAASRD